MQVRILSMILIALFFLCGITGNPATASTKDPIFPTAHFTSNFCNFPQAWTKTKGKGVTLWVIKTANESEKEKKQPEKTRYSRYAPETPQFTITLQAFITNTVEPTNMKVILLAEEPKPEQYQYVLKAIDYYTKKGTLIVMPAYFGPMKKDHDYTKWRQLVRDASDSGALIVGDHGTMYQLGNINFWKNMPIDIYALNNAMNDFQERKADAMITVPLEYSAYPAAGAAVLLKSMEPNLTPADIRQRFHKKNRPVVWAHLKVFWGEKPAFIVPGFLNKASLDKFLKEDQKTPPELLETFTAGSLDAGLLLDLEPMDHGEWSRSILRSAEANKRATGKDIIVAIVDHFFDDKHPALKGRVVKPVSLVEGKPVFDFADHGTKMAWELVKVAPGVKIMPIRFCWVKSSEKRADNFVKAIEYAVANGAKIISYSHSRVPESKRDALDAAIAKATEKGVVCSFIHYNGKQPETVVPDPIEFASKEESERITYVIGTNFYDNFPFTWGVSQTAPITAGVIAMMMEVNPDLTPMQIRQILLKSVRKNAEGFGLLDAVQAVENAEKAKQSKPNKTMP